MLDDNERFRAKVLEIVSRLKPPEPSVTQRVLTDDGEPIPEFLRQDKPLTPERLHALINPRDDRHWVMPGANRIEENMAKVDFQLDNRDAPVIVYRNAAEPEKVREFPNAEAFEAWYRPGKMRYLGRTTCEKFTDVLLDMDRATAVSTMGKPTTFVAKAANRGVQEQTAEDRRAEPTVRVPRQKRDTTGRYVDKRHVVRILACGVKQTSSDPITYEGRGFKVVIAPPPEGKAWSSSWTVTKGGKVLGTGKGIGGLEELLK